MIFEQDIVDCIKTLEAGGIILYPTDTVWGIGCDATNEEAVARIYDLKKRQDNKAMIVLVADERMVLKHVSTLDLSLFDYLETVTRPTTVIYQGALGLAHNLVGEDGSIAMRICSDEFCRHLIKRYRKPIVSTSANLSGEATPHFFKEINTVIKMGVDYIVKYRQQDVATATPSSIIRWHNGHVDILRP